MTDSDNSHPWPEEQNSNCSCQQSGCSCQCSNKPEGGRFHYRAQARVDTVEDGDTWFGRHKSDPTIVVAQDANHRDDDSNVDGQYYRLSRVNTHETDAEDEKKRKKAKREKEFTKSFIEQGKNDYNGSWPFIIEYESTDTEGSFGRRLVDLIRKTDGKELNDALLSKFGDEIKYEG